MLNALRRFPVNLGKSHKKAIKIDTLVRLLSPKVL